MYGVKSEKKKSFYLTTHHSYLGEGGMGDLIGAGRAGLEPK